MMRSRIADPSAGRAAIPLLVAGFLAAAPASAQQGASPADSADHAHAVAVAQAAPRPQRTPAPADAYCYIGWPNDGEVIRTDRIKVWFGTRNFGVAPAGVAKSGTGHHHLLIDTPLPPLDEAIPNDKNHLHFGLGQTETVIELAPGTHTLQLLMGDADHVPHDPPVMSKRITIHVKGGPSVAEAR
jgi:Domain of unknown function (DUF4399)